jgi:hypothetical protein
MTEALLIDIVVITLLGATIYFAFRLDRRLQGMRNVQHELATVIRELNTAASRAEAGIQGLKMAAQVSGSQLEEKIAAAKHAGDEIAILLKTTERLARAAESARHVEPVRYAEPARYAEPERHVEAPRYAEPARRAEPPRYAEPTRYAEPPRYAEAPRQAEPTRPAAPPQNRTQPVPRPALDALRALSRAG